MDRRTLLKSSIAASALAFLPGRAAAQPGASATRDARLFDLARELIERARGVVWRTDVVGIADYGLHSSQPRLHFVDLVNERVASYLVSHGDGSDPEHDGWLNRFSNETGSHCTSKGLYLTRSWYVGKYGTSIRLDGLDPTNSNALSRAIVMHPADYATPEHVARWGRLGRSNGCFAMGPEQFKNALIDLAGGRLLYADSLGFAADGSIVTPPLPQTELLRPEQAENTRERTNPGVF